MKMKIGNGAQMKMKIGGNLAAGSQILRNQAPIELRDEGDEGGTRRLERKKKEEKRRKKRSQRERERKKKER